MEVTNHNLLEDPEYHCVVAEMVDISEEMATQEALRAREQLLDRLAQTLPLGLLQVDADSKVTYTNDRLHHTSIAKILLGLNQTSPKGQAGP